MANQIYISVLIRTRSFNGRKFFRRIDIDQDYKTTGGQYNIIVNPIWAIVDFQALEGGVNVRMKLAFVLANGG